MDVRCGRCGTEYEFDDALVSERGTTVKCTSCGHQFKVYPGGTARSSPERWIVRKASGRELVYTSLRDLQRAIAQRQVGPSDMLSRGGGQPLRALASIAELEPFFQGQGTGGSSPGQPSSIAAAAAKSSTLLGIAPGGDAHSPTVAEDTIPDALGTTLPVASRPPVHPRRAPTTIPHGGLVAPGPASPAAAPPSAAAPVRGAPGPAPALRVPEAEPATLPRNPRPEGEPETQRGAAAGAVNPAPAAPVMDRPVPPSPAVGLTPSPGAVRGIYGGVEEDVQDVRDAGLPVPARRSGLRWVVGLVLLGGLGFLGATVGREYLELHAGNGNGLEEAADPRVTEMLERAGALYYSGDLEGAKEQLDKATVLADRDVTVLSALARIEAARGDAHWLRLKLLEPEDEAAIGETRRRLEGRIERVRRAAQAATAVAPSHPAVVRARIDAHRLQGELPTARELVASLGDSLRQPETAYTLAALDLAEEQPVWSSVIDRLREAARIERGLGRARGALIYALVESGDLDAARAELSTLEAESATHPLLRDLEAFLARREARAKDEPEPSKHGGEAARAEPSPPAERGDTAPAALDFRRLLEEASKAKSRGDTAQAETYYSAALQQQPGNVEALAGLGDVARQRGDAATAARYYDQVLAVNPSYLPAMMARADQKWAAGDRAGAVALYRRAHQQAGAGTSYGQRALARISEFESAATATPAAGEVEPSSPAPEAPADPVESTPHIDTTDLPEFQ